MQISNCRFEKGVLKHANKTKQTSKITGITEYYVIINADKNVKSFMAFLVKEIKSRINKIKIKIEVKYENYLK